MQERFSRPWQRLPHPSFPCAAPLTRGPPPGFTRTLPDLRQVTLTLGPVTDDGNHPQAGAGCRVERSGLCAQHGVWGLGFAFQCPALDSFLY